jgi:hypothetical protein
MTDLDHLDGMPGWDWGPESLLNYVADFFDHERVLGQPAERHIEYDSSRSLRSQLSNPEIASAVADTFIKYRKEGGAETAMQCFSVRQYPKYYRLGNMAIGVPGSMAVRLAPLLSRSTTITKTKQLGQPSPMPTGCSSSGKSRKASIGLEKRGSFMSTSG